MSLAFAPAVWMAYFLAVYALVSLACPASEALVRPGVTLATIAAIGFFAWFGIAGYRRSQIGNGTPAFIGITNALLCGLSAIGTLWVALPAFMLGPCAS
jgi:hypothetical protein